MNEHPAARTRVFFRRVFISRLEIAGIYHVPHDAPRIYLCYPLRLRDLIGRYWRVGLAAIRGDRIRVAAANPAARLAHWMVSAD